MTPYNNYFDNEEPNEPDQENSVLLRLDDIVFQDKNGKPINMPNMNAEIFIEIEFGYIEGGDPFSQGKYGKEDDMSEVTVVDGDETQSILLPPNAMNAILNQIAYSASYVTKQGTFVDYFSSDEEMFHDLLWTDDNGTVHMPGRDS